MKISPNLLADYYHNTSFLYSGSGQCIILYRNQPNSDSRRDKTHLSYTFSVKHYKPGRQDLLDKNILYLVREEELEAFQSQLQKTEVSVNYILIVSGNLSPEIPSLRKEDSFVIMTGTQTPTELIDALLDAAQELYGWDSYFTHGILHDHHTEELLQSLEKILPYDFVFSDMDGNIMYATEGYRQTRLLVGENRISSEITQDLFSHKEFHELIKEQDVFYFYTAYTDSTSLCQNLFINGRYIARLVMPLPEGKESSSPGLEELFRICLSKLKDLISNRNLLPIKHNNDNMHQMCRQLLEGSAMTQDKIEEVLGEYNWSLTDTYSLSIIKFESAPGWSTNVQMIYAFLIMEIEKNWYNACALVVENSVILIFNHNKETYPFRYDDYLQRIAYFVRDNLCKAGIAPLFHDFTQLKQAKHGAEIALEMGLKMQPHLWYYLFEDYRLAYMLQHVKQSADTALLCNPSLQLLLEYDAAHEGELTRTLKTYLECNMNMTNAAKKLFIHRTSFCRRMNHITELTGLDYENPDVVLDLLLSYRIMENE